MIKKMIIINTSFEAAHCWPDCPFEEVEFLMTVHRHIFHVQVQVITSEDRQIEFIMFKRKVNKYIQKKYEGKDLGSMSCEAIAEDLLKKFNASYVQVFEDGENGGAVFEDGSTI